jgi:apolipoprotein N-acyltransferase
MPVTLLSPAWRLVTGVLVTASIVTLPTYLVATLVLPPVPPIVMLRSFALGTALPAAMAWAILRAFRGTMEAGAGVLRLRRADLAVDVPASVVTDLRAWRLPLPMPGVARRVGPRERLPVAMAGDPVPLLDVLATAGVDVARARHRPVTVATDTRTRRGWPAAVAKFAGLGTIPALVLFYTHQHIAYGGTWGQWYLEGPLAWLRTLAEYWGTTIVLLVSWASCWRIPGELLVWLAAFAGDRAARAMRRGVETACALAYYAAVPAFLLLRYLA